MIKDIRFDLFKKNMEEKTKVLLNKYDSFDDQDAVSLEIYNDIVLHLELVGLYKEKPEGDEEASINYTNLIYRAIEKLYINHLKLLK